MIAPVRPVALAVSETDHEDRGSPALERRLPRRRSASGTARGEGGDEAEAEAARQLRFWRWKEHLERGLGPFVAVGKKAARRARSRGQVLAGAAGARAVRPARLRAARLFALFV